MLESERQESFRREQVHFNGRWTFYDNNDSKPLTAMSYSHTEWSVQCDVYVYVSPCHKAHRVLTLSFHPRRSATRTLTVTHDCHPAVRLSSSTILLFSQPAGLLLPSGLNVPASYPSLELRIHDRSFRLSFRLWPKCVILLLWALVASPMLIEIWMSSVS